MLTIRRPSSGTFDVGKIVQVTVLRHARHLTDDLTGARIGEEEVDAEDIFLTQINQVTTVRTQTRRDVQTPRIFVAGNLLSDRRIRLRQVRAVLLFDRLDEEFAQSFLGCTEGARRGDFQSVLRRVRKVRFDDLIAINTGHERPEHLPPAVGKVASAVELFERRHIVVQHGVAHPHGGVRVFASDAQIFGESLDHPERKVAQIADVGRVATQHQVVLEGVNEFVSQHVVRLRVTHAERHHYAVFKRLGHPARPDANTALNGGRLLKIGVIVVENDRVLRVDGIVQHLLVAVVPVLALGGELFQ